MVVVKRVVRTRPGLVMNSDSLTTILKDQGKTVSSSSLKSQQSNGASSDGKSCTVCFASEYNIDDDICPAPSEPLSEEEQAKCFYSVRVSKLKHHSLTSVSIRSKMN